MKTKEIYSTDDFSKMQKADSKHALNIAFDKSTETLIGIDSDGNVFTIGSSEKSIILDGFNAIQFDIKSDDVNTKVEDYVLTSPIGSPPPVVVPIDVYSKNIIVNLKSSNLDFLNFEPTLYLERYKGLHRRGLKDEITGDVTFERVKAKFVREKLDLANPHLRVNKFENITQNNNISAMLYKYLGIYLVNDGSGGIGDRIISPLGIRRQTYGFGNQSKCAMRFALEIKINNEIFVTYSNSFFNSLKYDQNADKFYMGVGYKH